MSGVDHAVEMSPWMVVTNGLSEGFVEAMRRNLAALVQRAREAEAERRYGDAVSLLGRDRGPHALDAWWPDLNLKERRQLVLEVWEMAEYPAVDLGEQRWVSMFKEVGFISDGRPKPTSPIRAWRGASVTSEGRGMSWTIDPKQAGDFAFRRSDRLGIPTAIYVTLIPPTAILALSGFSEDSRGEEEIIVDPIALDGQIELATSSQLQN